MQTVKVFHRVVYGNPTIYPADDYTALFCKLTGRKTFASRDLDTLKALGFQVLTVMDPQFAGGA